MDFFAFYRRDSPFCGAGAEDVCRKEFNETTTIYSVFVSRDNNRNNENTGRGGNR